MAFVPTRVHAIIDYAVGVGLIAAPEALGYHHSPTASGFTRAMGAAALGYILCTDYEFGALKIISMPVHMRIDSAWSVALALGPWIFGFGRKGPRYWVPHTVVALASAAIIACSEADPLE